jgi:hypothetical protein
VKNAEVGGPNGSRTHRSGLKGQRANRCTMGPRGGNCNITSFHSRATQRRLGSPPLWSGRAKYLHSESSRSWSDKVVVDRKEDMRTWVDCCYQIKKRGILIYAYANNHFAGYGPATIEQFRDLWYASGPPELERGRRMRLQTSLFDDPEESK